MILFFPWLLMITLLKELFPDFGELSVSALIVGDSRVLFVLAAGVLVEVLARVFVHLHVVEEVVGLADACSRRAQAREGGGTACLLKRRCTTVVQSIKYSMQHAAHAIKVSACNGGAESGRNLGFKPK